MFLSRRAARHARCGVDRRSSRRCRWRRHPTAHLLLPSPACAAKTPPPPQEQSQPAQNPPFVLRKRIGRVDRLADSAAGLIAGRGALSTCVALTVLVIASKRSCSGDRKLNAFPGATLRARKVCTLGSCGDDSNPDPLPPVNVIDLGSTTQTVSAGSVTCERKLYFPLPYGNCIEPGRVCLSRPDLAGWESRTSSGPWARQD